METTENKKSADFGNGQSTFQFQIHIIYFQRIFVKQDYFSNRYHNRLRMHFPTYYTINETLFINTKKSLKLVGEQH